jgi:hypothetical protein
MRVRSGHGQHGEGGWEKGESSGYGRRQQQRATDLGWVMSDDREEVMRLGGRVYHMLLPLRQLLCSDLQSVCHPSDVLRTSASLLSRALV